MKHNETVKITSANCGLATPYNTLELSEHWFKRVITYTNDDLSTGNSPENIAYERNHRNVFKITHVKSKPYPSEDNALIVNNSLVSSTYLLAFLNLSSQ